MNLQELLNEKTSEALCFWSKNDDKINSIVHKLKVILGEKFNGKIDNKEDLMKMIRMIKANNDAFKLVFFNVPNPKKYAEEIESLVKKFTDKEIENIVTVTEKQELRTTKERKIFSFVSEIENNFFEKEVGDIGNIFYSTDEHDSSIENVRKRIDNIIPVKAKIKGKTYLGIARPAGLYGGRGIITWQINAVEKNSDDDIQLPISVPLLQKSENNKSLKIHINQYVKNLIDDMNFQFDDSSSTYEKMKKIVYNILRKSGRPIGGIELKSLKDDDFDMLFKGKKNVPRDVPTWVFKDISFWNEVGKFF